jgi:metallo-beta-lactamase family protein
VKIKFLGAAGTVTGSGYLLTAHSGEQILIDLGLFQGPPEIDTLNYAPLEADFSHLGGVVLTHAHLDHCGRLPILEKLGFKGNIFMTAPTSEIAEISLLDSAKIGKEDHPENVLYDQNQVFDIVNRFKPVEYDRTFNIGGFKVTLRDAGHIIGSASVEVEADSHLLVFSGDLGNTPEDLTKPTQFISSADTVVMESTYGYGSHPPGQAPDIILSEINIVEQTNGTLLIPAFSIDRTQELLHIISHLKSKNLIRPQTPVYLDSPMAEKVTDIYEKYRSYLNSEINKDFLTSDPFSFPGMQIIGDRKDSSMLNKTDGSKVIIAGSGMMTGGRIVDHARFFLPIHSTRLLIVGYQGEGTLGRNLLNGEKEVRMGKQTIRVNAQITDTRVMSSHADQPRLINWLGSIKGVIKVILTHGENGPREILAVKIHTDLNISDVSLPLLNQEFDIS